jgi:hypothetical protein
LCVCVCSLTYPARNAHASYYTGTSGMSGCTTFFHIISNGMIFGEEHEKCAVIFSTSCV